MDDTRHRHDTGTGTTWAQHRQASYKWSQTHTRIHHTNGHTHAGIIQMVTHTQASYKWSHTHASYKWSHTHTHASYKQSHTRTERERTGVEDTQCFRNHKFRISLLGHR